MHMGCLPSTYPSSSRTIALRGSYPLGKLSFGSIILCIWVNRPPRRGIYPMGKPSSGLPGQSPSGGWCMGSHPPGKPFSGTITLQSSYLPGIWAN